MSHVDGDDPVRFGSAHPIAPSNVAVLRIFVQLARSRYLGQVDCCRAPTRQCTRLRLLVHWDCFCSLTTPNFKWLS